MRFPEYESMDATALAHAVAKGDISPEELLEVAIERIESRNPKLNAVVHKLYERAKSKVDTLPNGPLKGVPFLVKDLKMQIAGTPTSDGTKLMKGVIRHETSELAKRYEAAGLQILGKTNTPEFGIMGITEPEALGACRNPWNRDHTPGGSSGGSAAAVASGMVPVAHGGDGGGSIRIPAACCNLFGIKPTRGRVTMAPFMGEAWGGFVQEHVMSRSVRDSALLLDVVDAITPGEPYAAPHKEQPWVEAAKKHPGKLKIAYSFDTLFAGETHPECRAAVESSVNLLQELGHEVVEAKPRFDRDALVHAYFLTVGTGVANFVDKTAKAAGRKPRAEDFEPGTWLMSIIGKTTSAPELTAAQGVMQRAAREVAAFFEEYPVFVTSTMGKPPARIGELTIQPAERLQIELIRRMPLRKILEFVIDKMGSGKLAYTPNTQLFNQTGQPGMSMPLHVGASGLPIGTQFVGRFGDEATLFSLASQLEEARPWQKLAPFVEGTVAGE